MPRSNRLAFTSLFLFTALAGTACGGLGSADDANDPGAAPGDGPKATPVDGTPEASDLTEALGVFVAPTGRPTNAGTRESPLDTIQGGIALGTRTAKRVYVCSGTFREAIVIADSIAIIGGLDCTGGHWKLGAARTRIEAPSSPAVRAKDITSTTRLEGLDIVAPNATEPSGSSIGLLADHAGALVIVGSTITAGNGARGADGSEGTQLKETNVNKGRDSVLEAECRTEGGVTCSSHGPAPYPWQTVPGGLGGKSSCGGTPSQDGLPGGYGGTGGLWEPKQIGPAYVWQFYAKNSASYGPQFGQSASPATPGARGADGPPGAPLGALAADGYTASSGIAGTDGAPGFGGFGGRGSATPRLPTASTVRFDAVWRGASGPGGGAGGCPGLAGSAGTGGGASIAAALIDSPIVVKDSRLVAGNGGAGGRGTFGSSPTAGGNAGVERTGDFINAARPGGNGGAPGTSSNGSNGPSAGIMHVGEAPLVRGSTKITPGQGAPVIDARSRTDALGNAHTIPATAAGVATDILGL